MQGSGYNACTGNKVIKYYAQWAQKGVSHQKKKKKKTFKIISGEDKVERGNWFQLTSHNSLRTRRATEDRTHLAGKRIRTEARGHFFSQRVVRPWNELPEEVTFKPEKPRTGNCEPTEEKSRPRNAKEEMDTDKRSTRKLPDNSTSSL